VIDTIPPELPLWESYAQTIIPVTDTAKHKPQGTVREVWSRGTAFRELLAKQVKHFRLGDFLNRTPTIVICGLIARRGISPASAMTRIDLIYLGQNHTTSKYTILLVYSRPNSRL
jgi:hypothetical protein